MRITFILKSKEEKTVDFCENQTVFDVARKYEIHLNDSCEGFGVCGGCHVVVENLLDKLPKITEAEEDTLDRSHGLTMQSRLACQLVLDSSLDGLRVRVV
jgi:ferredoxin